MSVWSLQDAAQNLATSLTAFLNGKTEFVKVDEETGFETVYKIRNKT